MKEHVTQSTDNKSTIYEISNAGFEFNSYVSLISKQSIGFACLAIIIGVVGFWPVFWDLVSSISIVNWNLGIVIQFLLGVIGCFLSVYLIAFLYLLVCSPVYLFLFGRKRDQKFRFRVR